tara:strand:+ start:13823 stop:14278 length:456 start_codon:yes stop_codon:yes gene_type:complete
MAALSDYLESGLLNHVFRSSTFSKPASIVVALTSGTPLDSQTGTSILEIPSGINGSGTGYSRIDLGPPSDVDWTFSEAMFNSGSGIIANSGQIIFNTALLDWGYISGIAIVDHADWGSGNLLMHAQLDNPRIIYTGDNAKFDAETLEICFK